ncbi:hypothetical protein EDB87DRAFT_1825535 [Lactarius vividus]|nr:hypothetical protein EDB87DRAFT_1825535 [Lactarius vividus]
MARTEGGWKHMIIPGHGAGVRDATDGLTTEFEGGVVRMEVGAQPHVRPVIEAASGIQGAILAPTAAEVDRNLLAPKGIAPHRWGMFSRIVDILIEIEICSSGPVQHRGPTPEGVTGTITKSKKLNATSALFRIKKDKLENESNSQITTNRVKGNVPHLNSEVEASNCIDQGPMSLKLAYRSVDLMCVPLCPERIYLPRWVDSTNEESATVNYILATKLLHSLVLSDEGDKYSWGKGKRHGIIVQGPNHRKGGSEVTQLKHRCTLKLGGKEEHAEQFSVEAKVIGLTSIAAPGLVTSARNKRGVVGQFEVSLRKIYGRAAVRGRGINREISWVGRERKAAIADRGERFPYVSVLVQGRSQNRGNRGTGFVLGPAETPACDRPQIGFEMSPSGHTCSAERTAFRGARKHPSCPGHSVARCRTQRERTWSIWVIIPIIQCCVATLRLRLWFGERPRVLRNLQIVSYWYLYFEP